MKKLLLLLFAASTLLLAEAIHWEPDYDAAVKKATQLHKPILFVFSRHTCKWCRHLEATTFQDADVIARLNRDFVNVIAYTDDNDYVPRELWVPGTPALWFLDSKGEAMFPPIQGAVDPANFQKALDIVLPEFKRLYLK